ncbi:hypothetical protein HYV22_03790 [Candidatus Gottesmanbacteria bacterium]|nr:hypothetical protein [Candidatus Gottesmanbacteria bacterium]
MKKLAALIVILLFVLLGALEAPQVFAEATLKEGDACRGTGPVNLDRPWCWDACPGGTYQQYPTGYAFCTATPSEDCSISVQITTNPDKTFNLGVSINTTFLMPNTTKEIVIDTGLGGRPHQSFTVPPNTASIQLGFGPLDTSYSGKTYPVYVRYPGIEASGQSRQVGSCATQATFSPNAPSATTTNPLAPVPQVPGLFCDRTKTQVKTALGCIPTDPSAFIAEVLTIGIGIAGGIAFLLILFGGFQILKSTGNPEQLNAGKELVSSAIAGLLLIIFSVFILKVIGVNILGIPGFTG